MLDKLKFYGISYTYGNYGNFKKYTGMRKAKRNNKQNKIMSVKDIINKFNISYQTVNHYTDFGLLPISAKKGNVRFYNKAIVQKRLKKIKDLMKEGYSLRLIRKKLIGI